MHKNSISKKILALLMVVALLVTTVSVGILGILASAASVTVSNTDNAIIVVPETVYMTPSTGASTTGQYYVNNTISSGSYTVTPEVNASNTNGYVQFYIPGATDVTIAVNTVTSGIGDIVLAEAGATSGTYEGASLGALIGSDGYFAYNTVGLYISGTGITAGNTALAEWVFTVTMNDGSTRTYYAYSTLYAPWYQPVGAAARAKSSYRSTYASSVIWVSGVHGYSDGDRPNSYYVQTANFLPMFGTITTPTGNSPDGVWIQSGSNGLNPTMSYQSVDASGTKYHARANTISPTANITIDTSRYSNLNQIPNLKVGFMITDQDNTTQDNCSWYFSDFTGQTSSYYNGTATSGSQYTGDYNSQGTVIKSASGRGIGAPVYNDAWNKAISGSASLRLKGAVKSVYKSTITTSAWDNVFVNINVTGADKNALRQEVIRATTLNANNYTSSSWNTYQTALRTAAQNLGNPVNASVDTSSLTSARDALQTTVTLDANGGTIGTTSFNQTVGAASTYSYPVSSYVPTRTGYTFKGWSTSATATSGSTSTVSAGLKPTLYAVWEANSYKVVYDNLIDFSSWNTSSASNATISNVTSSGFTLTSNAGVGEGTSASPYFPVTPGKQYKIDIDFTGDSWDVYIFFCDASGNWIDFADGASNRYSSNGSTGVSADNAVFTAPSDSSVVKAQIRVDANGASNSVTFSNIRVYEVGTVEDGVSYETSKTVYYNRIFGTLATPTREHYTFLGWYKADGTKLNESDTVTITDNLYVTSKWEPVNYTVKWVYADGTEESETLAYGSTLTAPRNTSKATDSENHYYYSWSPEVTATVVGNATYTEVLDTKAHVWSDWSVTIAPNCTTQGTQMRTCSVDGHVEYATLEKTAHPYVDVVTPPTCTEKGYTTHTCSACGDEYIDSYVDALGHTLEEVVDREATCTAEGVHHYECTVCEYFTETEFTPVIPHTWGDVVVDKAPTCTETGIQHYKCAACGNNSDNEEIPALGHTEGETVVENNVDPTCTTDGSYENVVYCTVCDAELSRDTVTVGKLGHTEKEAVIENNVDPDCENAGSYDTVVYCEVCNAEISRVTTTVDALGHKYDAVVTDPTCTDKGFTTHTCSVCGDKYIDSYVDSLGHTEGEWVVTKEATCADKGEKELHCATCDEVIDEAEIEKLPHTYGDYEVLTKPTCTTEGSQYKTCTACGNHTTPEVIPALGHTDGETVVENNVDPTCTEDGSYENVVYCTVCDAELLRDTVTVEKLGHKAGDVVVENNVAPTCTEKGSYENVVYCSACDTELSRDKVEVEAYGHEYEVSVASPTCTEKGYTKYECNVCGDSYIDSYVDELGHTEAEAVIENNVDPTCTEAGSYDSVVYCSVCDAEVSRTTITVDALGHTEGEWVVTKEATCADKGEKELHCATCDEVIDEAEIEKLPHTYGDYEVLTKPTCTTEGSQYKTCTACGNHTTPEVIPALGHTEKEAVIENNVDPDCENAGSYDTVVYCEVCNAEISRVTTTVDALGHKEVIDAAVAPTCTETGLTEGSHCEVCGEVIVKQEVVEATGHTMCDWEVTTYPTFDATGLKTKSCANCDYAETEVLNPVKLRTTRIISSEIVGNTITITGYTNADSIGFYRTTAAGEDIIFDMYYDEEDLANEPTPIKYGDNSPRWIIYNSRWAQYAVDGKYTDKMTIAGVEYNFEVIMNSRELEANDVVLTEKFTNINVDNENKVITLIPPKGTESVTLKQTSREYDEFTYTIDADSYDNVTLNEVSGAYRGSYTISANGEFETEITVTVNKGKYCEEEYTLKVIFIDFDLVSELKPLRGAVSLETYEDGREYLKVTMADGQSSTGIYKTGKGTAITDVKVELDNGTMTEKDNLYVGYVKSNNANPTGEVTISLSNGSVLTYDIVFDMGITETEVDPLSELKLIRSTASFDEDGTLRITRNAGLAQSAGAGLYAVTTAGETVTFTTEQGTIYAGRTDAFIAYLTQNTSNVKGTISYTLSDGTAVEYKAVIDLGLGDEYVEPEEPAYDLATDIRAIRGTVSVEENTVTIKVAEGKTMTGIYNTTTSGATVEIVTENGTFADRTDAYVAYKAYNSANVEGTMTVKFADGSTAEYTVIFDLGL